MGIYRLIVLCSILVLCACKPGDPVRSFGYLNLGPVGGFVNRVTYLPVLRLLIVSNGGRLTVISTVRSEDSQVLERINVGQDLALRVRSTGDLYNHEGLPSSSHLRPLARYRAFLDASHLDGPVMNMGVAHLVVAVGVEQPPNWWMDLPDGIS